MRSLVACDLFVAPYRENAIILDGHRTMDAERRIDGNNLAAEQDQIGGILPPQCGLAHMESADRSNQ